LKFNILLEKQVQSLQYGTVTFNLTLKQKQVVQDSLNIVSNKRKRYKGTELDRLI